MAASIVAPLNEIGTFTTHASRLRSARRKSPILMPIHLLCPKYLQPITLKLTGKTIPNRLSRSTSANTPQHTMRTTSKSAEGHSQSMRIYTRVSFFFPITNAILQYLSKHANRNCLFPCLQMSQKEAPD
jgi:hypothetical protein